MGLKVPLARIFFADGSSSSSAEALRERFSPA
jgi:hypothetical protein